MSGASTVFRFDAIEHAYYLEGRRVPGITEMLDRTGWIDDTWYTEESSERGTAVHDLTAAYDLEALEVESCVSRYRGWLLGHVACMKILRPTWDAVEQPGVHGALRFGGRPDRIGRVYGLYTVLEIKSGGVEKSHQIQTALQAILASAEYPLPAEAWSRQALYLQDNGKFKLLQHDKRADFIEAYEVIRKCCR